MAFTISCRSAGNCAMYSFGVWMVSLVMMWFLETGIKRMDSKSHRFVELQISKYFGQVRP